MGVNIFGYIECPGWGTQRDVQRIFRHNRRVIEHLPLSDPQWPFITRTMFSMLPLSRSGDVGIPQYGNELMHFAGSYRNMFVVEAKWLTKFESILARLCWYSARVINAFADIEYSWRVDSDSAWDGYKADPPQPPTQWSFEVHKLDRVPFASSKAIDGEFASAHHVPALDATGLNRGASESI